MTILTDDAFRLSCSRTKMLQDYHAVVLHSVGMEKVISAPKGALLVVFQYTLPREHQKKGCYLNNTCSLGTCKTVVKLLICFIS